MDAVADAIDCDVVEELLVVAVNTGATASAFFSGTFAATSTGGATVFLAAGTTAGATGGMFSFSSSSTGISWVGGRSALSFGAEGFSDAADDRVRFRAAPLLSISEASLVALLPVDRRGLLETWAPSRFGTVLSELTLS
jgi:hypothetical protein